MAARKKWAKPQDIAPSAGDQATVETADPVLEKQRQYIKMLEERNRLRKKLAAVSKTQQAKESREEAFVTTFNVPGKPQAAGSGGGAAGLRPSKSAATVLPTRFAGDVVGDRLTQCKSAPMGLLPRRSDGDGNHERPPRTQSRAKWNRPLPGNAPMLFGADAKQDSRATDSDAKQEHEAEGEDKEDDDDDDEIEEETYLEESFEEFDGDAEEATETHRPLVDSRAEAKDEIHEEICVSPPKQKTEAAAETTSPTSALSRTTNELFGMIKHLSRSKQKALIDVLQQFQASGQSEQDVNMLQSSIGDPEIWKQVTSALFADPKTTQTHVIDDSKAIEVKTAAAAKGTLDEVLREQALWEQQYAREMKDKLVREREAKEKAMRDAEERRLAMMKQLEEEERELERLMERKRQERLAKLKALELEMENEAKVKPQDSKATQEHPTSTVASKSPTEYVHQSKAVDEPEVKPRSALKTKANSPKKKKTQSSSRGNDAKSNLSEPETMQSQCVEEQVRATPIVPLLNLSAAIPTQAEAPTLATVDLRIKLLSTWSNTRAVGLTQICAYDVNGDELPIDTASLRLYDQVDGRPLAQSHEMVRGLNKLLNGIAQTNNDRDMWLGRLPNAGVLQIGFQVCSSLSKLCIWNYNNKSCNACARDIEVLVNEKCVWTGSLPETFGDEDDSMCTWINVLAGVKKTARTVRQDEVPVLKKSTRAVPTTSSDDSSSVNIGIGQSTPRSTTATPLWLSSSSSSGAQTSRSSSNLDMCFADEKALNGSVTERRRQHTHKEYPISPELKGKDDFHKENTSEDLPVSRRSFLNNDYAADAKPNAINIPANRQQHKPALSSPTACWDSLEHFSKTNRSRLPLTTDERDVPSLTPRISEDKPVYDQFPSSTRTAITSSLLTELKANSMRSLPITTPRLSHQTSTTAIPVQEPMIQQQQLYHTADIPVLPCGNQLKLEILSTWGDPHYVGLNGIELFDQHGQIIHFPEPEAQILTCPADINVLEEYEDDPRVAKNLVDGVNFTCDDFHMWLAPFTAGKEHFVLITLGANVSLSMVRIWNYNKSRTHSFRGVKRVRLLMMNEDHGEREIFDGEIEQAPGIVSADRMEQCCEVILFTREDAILRVIEENDEIVRQHARSREEEEETTSILASMRDNMESQRPRTSDKSSDRVDHTDGWRNQEDDSVEPTRISKDGRPMTAAVRPPPVGNSSLRKSVDQWMAEEPQQKSPVLSKITEKDNEGDENDEDASVQLIRGRQLTIQLLSTWGDLHYIGLNQLDVLVGSQGTPLPLDLSRIDATPRDLASLGYDGDPRTLDKLIDGVGTTCDDTHMWLIPLDNDKPGEIRITFKTQQLIYGLRIWNYNKSSEDTFRGVKQIHVFVDGSLISPKETGVIIRKAPGNALFDFDQVLRLSSDNQTAYLDRIRYPFQARTYKTPLVKQDYEPSLYPQGFILKLICWTTWGDPYYLGLNGLEIYDFHGKLLTIAPHRITAKPYSITEISKSGEEDARVPANLLSGRNKNTWEANDAWLAPLASSLGNPQGNLVFIVFDEPIVISLIKFWNYSKTPERGVKDLDIYLDDQLVYSGSLRKAPPGGGVHALSARNGSKITVVDDFSQPIVFSTNQAVVDLEKRKIFYCGADEQDVLGINEGQVMHESKAMYRKPDPGAEGVVVDLGLRPMTAMCRQ